MDVTRQYYKPTYEFFIPSIYDDTAIACRIYSVQEQHFAPRRDKPWTPRGAVFAHPYTGLGGSYDDRVILELVKEHVNVGCTVGTFNLRWADAFTRNPRFYYPDLTAVSGAGKSKGKASWDSKPELQDYISFVGFFMLYLTSVYPPVPGERPFDDTYALTPIWSEVPTARPPADLVLGGYSYGALLTRHLPNVPAILGRFSKVLKTSTEAEIRLRAATLAAVTVINVLDSDLPSTHDSPTINEHLTFLQTPFVRKEKKNSWREQSIGEPPDDDDYISRVEVPSPKTHYLLVSLVLGPIASAAAGFRKLSSMDIERLDEKFMYNTTGVIHGKDDKLVSLSKVDRWIHYLRENSEGRCQLVGIPGAGHFWREDEAIDKLVVNIRRWATFWIGEGNPE